MVETESFSLLDFSAEFIVLLPQIEEGVHISGIGILEVAADIAGFLFLSHPHADGVSASRGFLKLVLDGSLCGLEAGEFFFHFSDDLFVMGLQNPGIAQGIAVVKHLLKMLAAEAGLVCHFADVGLHVGGTAAQHEIQQILLHASLNEAKRALVARVHGVV